MLLPDFDNIYDQLLKMDVTYVIFGIKEDVGVFANYGNTGTSDAWDSAIKVLLNTQSNAYTHANKVLLLGHLNFEDELEELSTLNQNKSKDINRARALVDTIDKQVTDSIYTIVKAGKTPIIIGGGHNNAYGNIKGTSLAKGHPINVINFDAHTDFRAQEGRHSGNGFSYAIAEGFLNNYFIFGLHENYTSQTILDTLNSTKTLAFNSYEAIEVRKELKFKNEMKRALNHIDKKYFGLEIDCDAIENIPSSAKTPSGFSVDKSRQFVNYFGNTELVSYIHICEAAPTKKTETQVGKLISYLITDFIRSNTKHHEN
jgi:formiminoglutamase